MATPPRIRLTEAEKDALLLEQAALIGRMAARIAELEALVGKPRKTSSNSSIPPRRRDPDGRSAIASSRAPRGRVRRGG